MLKAWKSPNSIIFYAQKQAHKLAKNFLPNLVRGVILSSKYNIEQAWVKLELLAQSPFRVYENKASFVTIQIEILSVSFQTYLQFKFFRLQLFSWMIQLFSFFYFRWKIKSLRVFDAYATVFWHLSLLLGYSSNFVLNYEKNSVIILDSGYVA